MHPTTVLIVNLCYVDEIIPYLLAFIVEPTCGELDIVVRMDVWCMCAPVLVLYLGYVLCVEGF